MDISPYDSVQKPELYAILMVLRDFKEPLNIVTNGKYAKRVVLHIITADLHQMIQNWLYYLLSYKIQSE